MTIQTPKHRRRWWAAAFLLAFLLSATSGAALAGTATSSSGYYTINGINYRNYAAINTNHGFNHQAYGVTVVTPRNTSAGSGWVGALPRRHNSSGALLCTGTWKYNSGTLAVNQFLNPTGCFINNHSIYSSKGQTRGWTGSGYSTYNTFLTPNQNS